MAKNALTYLCLFFFLGSLLPIEAFSVEKISTESDTTQCNEKFYVDASKKIKSIIASCNAIIVAEPSECQSSLSNQCKNSFAQAKEARSSICQRMITDSKSIEEQQYGKAATSQTNAQLANAQMNRQTESTTDILADLVEMHREKAQSSIKQLQTALKNQACYKSTYNNKYKSLTNTHINNLKSYQAFLLSYKKDTLANSTNAASTAASSEKKASSLASTGASPTTTGGSGSNSQSWAPWIIGGGAAALLGAALLSEKGPVGPIPGIAPSENTGMGTASGSTVATSNMAQYDGNADELLKKYNIRVDNSFTDAQKRMIAQAVQLIPECHRGKLSGLVIDNNINLKWSGSNRCLPGKQVSTSPPRIQLNANCYGGVSTALVVHEMFHVVGHKGVLSQYRRIFNENGQCPVSDYSAYYKGNNASEDFAEAARLAVYPGSGGQLQPTCVQRKISSLKQTLHSCK